METQKPFLTLQEIFDTVSKHLLIQKERSYDPVNGWCMYRGPRGLKCAVGILISDDLYDEAMENEPVGFLFSSRRDVIVGSGIDADSNEACRLLRELQFMHDGEKPSMWESSLKDLASRFDLSFNTNLE
jgi:hypothetical protein